VRLERGAAAEHGAHAGVVAKAVKSKGGSGPGTLVTDRTCDMGDTVTGGCVAMRPTAPERGRIARERRIATRKPPPSILG
jgi:hypothetical protein